MDLNYMINDLGCRESPKFLYDQTLISIYEMSD